jgi:hypothetical protein
VKGRVSKKAGFLRQRPSLTTQHVRTASESQVRRSINGLIRRRMDIEGDASDGEPGASPDPATRRRGVEFVAPHPHLVKSPLLSYSRQETRGDAKRSAHRVALLTAQTMERSSSRYSTPYHSMIVLATLRLVTRMLILVANSKMGEMTRSILTAEGHRNWVDTCAEIAAAVGDRRVERIRHQCQCWYKARMRHFPCDQTSEDTATLRWPRRGARSSTRVRVLERWHIFCCLSADEVPHRGRPQAAMPEQCRMLGRAQCPSRTTPLLQG